MANGGMKLRVRAASGGGTLRIQVPSPARIYDLRHSLSQMIGVPADSIRLSLNKRDEIQGDSSVPLAAYGIRSGDLIYYFDPDAAGTDFAALRNCIAIGSRNSGPAASQDAEAMAVDRRELCAAAADKRAREAQKKGEESSSRSSSAEAGTRSESGSHSARLEAGSQSESGSHSARLEQGQPSTTTEEEKLVRERDEELLEDSARNLIPNLLSRLLSVDGQTAGNSQDLLIFAIHAVMVESGFVAEDEIVRASSQGLLRYTLPQLEQQRSSVLLRCQKVGDFMVIYGSVSGSPQIFRLSLSVSKFLRQISPGSSRDSSVGDLLAVYKDAFALWKEIKDNLTLRLLILVCEIAGLPLPSCFQVLPSDLKVKILEFLPAIDVARLSCVSSELRFLAANESLWRSKFLAEFRWRKSDAAPSSWKVAFVREWYARRRRQQVERGDVVHSRRIARPHHPWGIIGGDYDVYPEIPLLPGRGGINPFGGPRFRRPLNPGCIGPASSGIGTGLMGSEQFAILLPRPDEIRPPGNFALDDRGSARDVDMDDIV